MIRKILVTGGLGFIGRHVVRLLLERGYFVRIVDQADGSSREAMTSAGAEVVFGDLRDTEIAQSVFDGVDACIALAARSSGIGFFNTHPAEMLDDNTRLISATFESAIRHRIGRLVYVSSSCAFDNSKAYPITENALKVSPPPSPGYPFSKLIGEFYCRAYQKQYGLTYTIIRPFNAYGPGELPGKEPGDSHVIPDLTNKILRGQLPLEIFGNGEQTRCFTHVGEIARGLVLAMESPSAINEDFNLGHPNEITIRRLAEVLWKVCGRQEEFSTCSIASFEHDVARRAVDISKAKMLLGWEPIVDLESGLAEYVGWYKSLNMAESKA